MLNVQGRHDLALLEAPGLAFFQARPGLTGDTFRQPITGMRAGLAADAGRSFDVVDLHKGRGSWHGPAGGGFKDFGFGQLVD